VVVTMDFMAQVQNYMMSQQYESLLKKANFKGSAGGWHHEGSTQRCLQRVGYRL